MQGFTKKFGDGGGALHFRGLGFRVYGLGV